MVPGTGKGNYQSPANNYKIRLIFKGDMDMSKKIIVIVNPASSNGKTRKRWPKINKLLSDEAINFDYKFTEKPGDAASIAKRSLEEGYQTIVVVGGDGTLNEAVNGYLSADKELIKNAAIGVISMGTGGDFVRTAGIPKDPAEAVKILARGNTKDIDVGVSRYTDDKGEKQLRYFCNTTDVGLGGETATRVNKTSKALGGFISFLYGVIVTLILYKSKEVDVIIDDEISLKGKATTLVVTNGRYFGGGMKITPTAELDDGLLDILFLPHFSKLKLLFYLPRVYKGTHLSIAGVKYCKGKKVRVTSTEELIIEIDGETPGKTPVEMEIMPKALKIIK